MFNNMFDNIGGKFKGLAKVYFWFLTVASLGTSLVTLMVDTDVFLFVGLPCLAGPLLAWISSLGIYAIGEIIDTLYAIAASPKALINTSATVKSHRQLLALESNLKLGMITQEEYQAKRAEIINNL